MTELTRAEIDASREPLLIEFGASWCGYCQAAKAHITAVMKAHPAVRHIKVEDAEGLPLGRSFRVQRWPTLIYIEGGAEKGRVVRPRNAAEIEALFSR
jgi:thioredoxin 1